MKQKLFLTIAMMMAVCSFCRAKEAYAVYDPVEKTLTFYYDNKKLEKPSSYTYLVNPFSETPDWLDAGRIDEVMFNYTFADYRPTTTYKWFYNLEDLDMIIGIDYLKTDNVTDMSYMFYGCFHLCHLDGLVVNGIDNWNTGNVTDMSYMFYGCYALKSLNVGSWNTGNVTDMSWMFNGCSNLASLDVSGWNTGKVTNMKAMFAECETLKNLNLSDWNTSKVTDMSWMFYNCKYLERTYPLNGWNTAEVTDMAGRFSGCKSLEKIEFSAWNTSNVTNMQSMFWECTLETLDFSGWNTGKVTNMDFMFYDCSGLMKIYVGDRWNTGKVSSSNCMFYNCNQLVGGSGTKYNSSHIDATYARIDGGTSRPGYFSTNLKEYNLTIAGTKVTNSNMSDVLDNGVFSYSPSTKTLTVKGSYTSGDADIICNEIYGLTIDVTQNAVLANNGARTSIWLKKNTTIKGEGKLTLKTNDNPGIYLTDGASATIENMNMDIEAFWGISGPSNPTGEKITIKSSNITIITSTAGNQYAAAICDLPGGIILEDCSITYPTNATLSNNGVCLGNSTTLAKDVTIKAKVGISTGGVERLNDNGQMINDKAWFTIDGRKLNGKPTQKGIYIQNGNKRIIK